MIGGKYVSWELVLGIITLVGFIISIAKIVSNNTKALTEVKCSIDSLRNSFNEQKDDFEHVKYEVNEHETRISILEHK